MLWQFYTSEKFLRRYGDGSDKPVKLQVPDDDSPSTYADQLLLKLRKPWKPTGAKGGGGPPPPPPSLLGCLLWRSFFF